MAIGGGEPSRDFSPGTDVPRAGKISVHPFFGSLGGRAALFL